MYNQYMQTIESFMQFLHQELQQSRKLRDKIRVQVLQSLIARIDNAEAIPVGDAPAASSGNAHIAGASSGLGSTEAIRKMLTMDDVDVLINEELDEIQKTLEEVNGQEAYEEELRQKQAVLEKIKQEKTIR